MNFYTIDLKDYSLDEIEGLARSNQKIELSEKCIVAIQKSRSYLDEIIEETDQLIYGINTGFGSLCDSPISKLELAKLQKNLVVSHACGMGNKIPSVIVKRMLLLKILGLSKGFSGISMDTIQRLIYFYNQHFYPVVFEQGSLGASGDLAPLAHLSLPLLGLGQLEFEGKVYESNALLTQNHIQPLTLESKEGLALLNGTQFMSAYAMYCVGSAQDLIRKLNSVAAISIDAYDCRLNPFQQNVNAIRKQNGQIEVAHHIRKILAKSEIATQHKAYVQDPYSFRCIPQVHGASLDAIRFVSDIVEREINAVTDNPTIFVEDNQIVSAGNFHGQPLALAMDFLSIALAELGSISERRSYKLLSGTRGLPSFLVKNPGLNSGLMIVHYSCASIVSQNKHLANPASTDTIDSSNGQEDHVSMGANAATKLFKILDNCYSIVGVELLTATQALEFRRPLKSTQSIEEFLTKFRKSIPFVEEDCLMHDLMMKSKGVVESNLLNLIAE